MLANTFTPHRAVKSFAALLALTTVFSGSAAAQYWDNIDKFFTRVTSGTLLDESEKYGKVQLSFASDGTLVSVDTKNQIWNRNFTDNKWAQLPGLLKHVSVASKSDIWGINPAGKVFRSSLTTPWVEIPPPAGGGAFNRISAASDGTVVGIMQTQDVYLYDGKAKTWSQMPGKLVEVAVGSASKIWGISSDSQIWRIALGQKDWTKMPGALKNISASADGEVWGTGAEADLWRYSSSSNGWKKMLGKLQYVAVGSSDYLAGVTKDLPLPLGTQAPPADAPPPYHTVIGKKNNDFCWKATTTRGVGTIPSNCAYNKEKRGLLCYPTCKAGYTAFVASCFQQCPAGFRDDGLLCNKPAAYGRGAGYPWQFGDPAFKNDGQMARCQAAEGVPCEQNGALVFPTCKAGFAPVGGNVCSPVCPAGMGDTGVGCTKQTYTQAAATLQCAPGQVNDAGLCYPACGASSVSAGPVCWGRCQGDTPFECAAGCAKDQAACAQHTADIVISTISSVISIASMAFAPGAGDVVNAAMTQGFKEVAKVAFQYAVPKLADKAIKESIQLSSELAGTPINSTATNNWSTFLTTLQSAGANSNDINTAYNVIDSLPVDPALLDITGLTKVVMTLANPICKAPIASWDSFDTTPMPASK